MSQLVNRLDVQSTHLLIRAKKAYAAQHYAECAEACKKILFKAPQHPEALSLGGYAHFKLGHWDLATDYWLKTLKVDPGNAKVIGDIAVLLFHQRKFESALEHFKRLASLTGPTEDLSYSLGFCCQETGHRPEALAHFSDVIEKNPKNIKAFLTASLLLHDMGKHRESIGLLDIALQINARSTELLHCQAKLLTYQGLLANALSKYELLQEWGDEQIDHLIDHAELLTRLKRGIDAESKFREALNLDPHNRRALTCYARLLFGLKKYDEALALFEKILSKNPHDSSTLVNVGNIHFAQRKFTEATELFRRAYEANPHGPEIAGSYLYAMSFICQWEQHQTVLDTIESDQDHTVSRTFPSVIFENSPKANLAYAQATIKNKFMPTNVLGELKKYTRKQKIRIGYYSSDFYHHATVMLIEGMLRAHDRSQFEIHAFSLDFTRQDNYNARIRDLFDQYHDVSRLSDGAVTLLSRQLEIDIAIDLKGFTEGSRTAIFAERAAPVQINYLGFPGSMGAPYMDYMVADRYTITADNRPYFSENILWMPDCYQPNNPGRPQINADSPRPAELPGTGFVFCSFNNTYKLTPKVFDQWLKILKKAPGSVLWLLQTTPEAESNLLAYAKAAGVAPERIAFAPMLLEVDHLQRMQYADLFLDSFPCNAHTTASDALWAGVPLITRSGQTFASRVAGSILKAVGLEELIVESEADYEALALRIYQDRNYHRELQRRVKQGVAQGALYDANRYTRHFERALIELHDRHHQGLCPQDLDVSALQPLEMGAPTASSCHIGLKAEAA